MQSTAASRIIQKYPLSATAGIGLSVTSGYAVYIEQKALARERSIHKELEELSLKNNTLLPREYDSYAINNYWSERPITVMKRFISISIELTPIVGYYIRDFKILPKLLSSFPTSLLSVVDDETNTSNEGAKNLLEKEHATRLRAALTKLGPAFVKAGQQLSIRPDLIPPSVLKELQQLCDEVEPIPDDLALELLENELIKCCSRQFSPSAVADEENTATSLEDIFYEKPHRVASASLGQVYKGKLKYNDEEVAIKVQRPGMLQSFSLDLFLLKKIGYLLDIFTTAFTNQEPYHEHLFDTFAKGSYLELDYENEAKNQIHFKKELEKRKSNVLIPQVYEQYTTQHILTTQWIDGIRLSDSSQETLSKLIPVGVELFLTQLLDIGAFHSDPHPGNLLVTRATKKNGSNNNDNEPILCLLDFGLCAEIDDQSKNAMTKAIVHLLIKDFDSLISEDAIELGFLPEHYNTDELKPILTKILTNGLLEPGSNLHQRKRKLMEISNELNEIFFKYPFNVPPFFALITRGLGLLEGIALTGDPNFDIFRASAPYATRRAAGLLGSHSLMKLRRMGSTSGI